MPIFVDEVVISVEVENRPTESSGASASPSAPSTSEDRQTLVAECVERVLEIFAQRQER